MKARKIFQFLFSFRGRMTRKPFWIAYAINRVVYYSLAILFTNIILEDRPLFYGEDTQHSMTGLIILIAIPLVFAIINGLSLVSRRFHDTGRSFLGYLGMYCIASVCRFIPFLGSIFALGIVVYSIVLLCLPTDFEDETYGPAPKRDVVSEENNLTEEEQRRLEEYNLTHLNGILLEPAEEDDKILFEDIYPDWSLN